MSSGRTLSVWVLLHSLCGFGMPIGFREQVFGYVEREDAKGFFGIGRVGRRIGAVCA
jgi:hypothetical protein